MDRQMVLDHLALAERHVAEGKITIERQQSFIADLGQGGHDTTLPQELLSRFLDTQRSHEEDRERLRRELAQLDAKRSGNDPESPLRLRG